MTQNLILSEEFDEDLLKIFSGLEKATKSIYRTAKTLGIENTKFLLTYSAIIGALVRPLNASLSSEFPNLTDSEKILLIIGVCSVYYNQNASEIRQISRLIREKNLTKEFNSIKKSTEKMMNLFRIFISNTTKSAKMINEIVFFIFLLPVLDYILKINAGAFSSQDLNDLAKRIVALSVISVNQSFIKKILQKVAKKSKQE